MYPARSSLDSPSKLDRPKVPNEVEGRWLLNLYPGAREAGGCFVSAARPGGRGGWWEPDPEKAADERARRARAQLRRYCAANLLNRSGDLTYAGAGQRDERELRAEVASFFRRIRRRVGQRIPYVWVPEWHPGGHGLHVHFAFNRFVLRSWIAEAWGRGFVWIELKGGLPAGSGALEEARISARYLAKYIGKELRPSTLGLHRYEVAEGFRPRKVRIVGDSLDEVRAQAAALMGGEPRTLWDSATAEDWVGPHAVWMEWAG